MGEGFPDRLSIDRFVGDSRECGLQKLSDERPSGEKSEAIRERVKRAREIQNRRFSKLQKPAPRKAPAAQNQNQQWHECKELGIFAPLSEDVKNFERKRRAPFAFRPRVSSSDQNRPHHRRPRNSEDIKQDHVLEALQYRPKVLS